MKYAHTNIISRDWKRLAKFYIDDVENIQKTIISYGGKALGEITTKEIPGVGEITFVYTADPEGNIIEIQNWR